MLNVGGKIEVFSCQESMICNGFYVLFLNPKNPINGMMCSGGFESFHFVSTNHVVLCCFY